MENNFDENFSKGLFLASKDKYSKVCDFLDSYYRKNKKDNWSFGESDNIRFYNLGENGIIHLNGKYNNINWEDKVPKILVECIEKICEFPLC